jgi:hypothetical protein
LGLRGGKFRLRALLSRLLLLLLLLARGFQFASRVATAAAVVPLLLSSSIPLNVSPSGGLPRRGCGCGELRFPLGRRRVVAAAAGPDLQLQQRQSVSTKKYSRLLLLRRHFFLRRPGDLMLLTGPFA